jgi:hypothetical protein
MSTKNRRWFILGATIVNLFVVLPIIWVCFIAPPYSRPSQREVEKEAAVIAERLTAGDVNYVLSRYDLNAIFYFDDGVANWVDEAKQQERNRELEASLAGMKECVCKQCNYTDKSKMNSIFFEITFEDGVKLDANAVLYKDRWGKVGIAVFGVVPEELQDIFPKR